MEVIHVHTSPEKPRVGHTHAMHELAVRPLSPCPRETVGGALIYSMSVALEGYREVTSVGPIDHSSLHLFRAYIAAPFCYSLRRCDEHQPLFPPLGDITCYPDKSGLSLYSRSQLPLFLSHKCCWGRARASQRSYNAGSTKHAKGD